MTLIGVAILMIVVSLLGIVFVARRRPAISKPIVAPDLAARVLAAARAFVDAPPWHPSSAIVAPPTAAAIETALIAGDAKRALELAEAALQDGADDRTRVWLAWALCANSQPAAALNQLALIAERDPLAAYVHARAEHLAFEHAAGASGPVPPLVTTADLALVTLATGRGGAAWLTGKTEVSLSKQQIAVALADHRALTARCLTRALDALAGAPGFADAAYLVGRLAVKAGAVAAGRAMFDALAPRIVGRPDADAAARDLADLRDPAAAVAMARQPPVPPTAKRSHRLKVL